MTGLISQHAEAASFIFVCPYKMAQIMRPVNMWSLMEQVKKHLDLYTPKTEIHTSTWPQQ